MRFGMELQNRGISNSNLHVTSPFQLVNFSGSTWTWYLLTLKLIVSNLEHPLYLLHMLCKYPELETSRPWCRNYTDTTSMSPKNQHSQSEKNLIRFGNLFKIPWLSTIFKISGGDGVDLRSTSFAARVQNNPIDLLQPRTLGTEAGSSIWEGVEKTDFWGVWGGAKIKDLFVSVDAWMSSVMIIIWYGI